MILRLFPLWALSGCPEPADDPQPAAVRGEMPEYTAQSPVFRRLTYAQYVNVVGDLFGDGLVLPNELEPDTRVSGLYAVGASVTSFSSLGVERLESTAFDIGEQVMADSARKSAVIPCTPAGSVDDECARTVVSALGAKAWRRPMSSEETERLVTLANTVSSAVGDFDSGIEYVIAALLQSPYFLFIPELGEDDPQAPGTRRYTNYEMASRLSFFLWDSMPDDDLFAAAAAGELVTESGVIEQVDRMLADDRAREGLRAFLTDMLLLDELDSLTKDPLIYTHMSAGLADSARQQTLSDAELLVFDDDVDFRTFLSSTETHLDRTLAALYDVPAPAREGFALASLPENGGRRGFLGHVSFLALQSHPTSTSATLRGLFVREVLLCQELPSPPAGLNTSIPETTAETPTMRDRVAQHLEDPTCATCHAIMDPVGLGLENFDGIGRWRTTENDVTIDASGDLDGKEFSDAWDLAGVVAATNGFPSCVNDTLYHYANARTTGEGETDLVSWHDEGFSVNGFRLKFLLKDIATGPAFRTVGGVE